MTDKNLYKTIWERKLCLQNIFADGMAIGSRHHEAANFLVPGVRLLDVGCGDGAFACSQSYKFKETYGADLVTEALESANAKGIKTSTVDLDTQHLPFEDAFFDAVTCLDVIEHVVDPARLVRECARVLSPGGRLIIATPNIRYLKHVLKLIFGGRSPRTSIDKEGYDGGHLHYFTSLDIEAILSSSGLSVIAARGIIPGTALGFLRPLNCIYFVREFFSAASLIVASKGMSDHKGV